MQEILPWVNSFFESGIYPSHTIPKIMADWLEEQDKPLGKVIRLIYSSENSFTKRALRELFQRTLLEYPGAWRIKFITRRTPVEMHDIVSTFVNLFWHQDLGYGWDPDDNRWFYAPGRRVARPIILREVPNQTRIAVFVFYMIWRVKLKLGK